MLQDADSQKEGKERFSKLTKVELMGRLVVEENKGKGVCLSAASHARVRVPISVM